MGVSGQRHAPGRALPPGKGLPVPIGQEAGWAPEPVWTQRIEEKIFPLCRGSNIGLPVRSQDTILIELPRFLHCVHSQNNNLCPSVRPLGGYATVHW
jgi:hypothetical protein